MDFFKDETGRLHAGRIVGVIYILAVVFRGSAHVRILTQSW